MPEIRQNKATKDWVIIATERAKRPEDFKSKGKTGKILPARVTGTCSYHQKQLSKAINRARHMAFLKFIEPKRG